MKLMLSDQKKCEELKVEKDTGAYPMPLPDLQWKNSFLSGLLEPEQYESFQEGSAEGHLCLC